MYSIILLKFNSWLYVFHFPGTGGGESAGGSLVGVVPGGSTFTGVSGTFTWAGEEVGMLGETPRHFLRLLPGTEPSHWGQNKQKKQTNCRIGHLDVSGHTVN